MRKYLASLFFLGLTASVVFGGGGKVDTLGVGQPAPTFYLKTLAGDEIWLRAFCGPVLKDPWKNKVKSPVLISFFATWCKPCKREIPIIQKIYDEFTPQGLKVFMVDTGEGGDSVKTFVETFPIKMPVLLDTYLAAADKYGARSLPRLFLLDKQGVIRFINKGMSEDPKAEEKFDKTLRAKIAALLAEGDKPSAPAPASVSPPK